MSQIPLLKLHYLFVYATFIYPPPWLVGWTNSPNFQPWCKLICDSHHSEPVTTQIFVMFSPIQIFWFYYFICSLNMSSPLYHCKHNCIIWNNIIICIESTCANYRCKTIPVTRRTTHPPPQVNSQTVGNTAVCVCVLDTLKHINWTSASAAITLINLS